MKIFLRSVDGVKKAENSKIATSQENNNDESIFNFENNSNRFKGQKNNKAQTEKTDMQQLNEDAVYLAELWQAVQDNEPWAFEEAKKLQVAASPEKSDNSQAAQLLRSNNELAQAIKDSIGAGI